MINKLLNKHTIYNDYPILPSFIFVSLMFCSFFLVDAPYQYNIYQKYFIGIFIICIGLTDKLIKTRYRHTIPSFGIDDYFVFITALPYIIMCLHSLIVNYMIHDNMALLTRSFAISIYSFIAIFEAMCVIEIFGKKAIKLTFIAAVLNYSYIIIVFLIHNGFYVIISVIKGFSDPLSANPFEVHEITFIFGLFVIYFCLVKNSGSKKYRIVCCVLSVCYMFLGFKRILIVAIIIALFIGLFLTLIKSHSKASMKILGISAWLICLLYVIGIKNDWLSKLANRENINTMGRIFIYSQFNKYYDIGLMYMGQGSGFVQKMIESLKQNSTITFSAMHNDILTYYIDLGFIGFSLFFMNLSVLNVNRIIRHSSLESAVVYFTLFTMTIICFTTDNLATYHNYLVVFFMMFFCLAKYKIE